MTARANSTTLPVHRQAGHQGRKIRAPPPHHSETSPLSSDAAHIGQNFGRSSRWRAASEANQSPGGGSRCGSGGNGGMGPWWAARPAVSFTSRTGGGLLARRGRVVVQGEHLLPDRAVAHRAAVDPLVDEGGAGAELVLLAGQVDDLVPLADHARRVLAVLDRRHGLLEHLPEHRDALVRAPEVLLGAVGDRALRDPRHHVLALDVVGDELTVLVAVRELVHDRPVLL